MFRFWANTRLRLLAVFVLATVGAYVTVERSVLHKRSFNSDEQVLHSEVPGGEVSPALNIFDLSKRLEPTEAYNKISCQETSSLNITTTLCNYDKNTDHYAKVSPWFTGLREPEAFENFLQSLLKNPDFLVFDFGVFVGQYTLYSAKLKHRVISVEAFYDNLLRIHKGAVINNLTSYITLFHNGLSDKPNEIKRLEPAPSHVARQNLVKFENEVYTSENSTKVEQKYLVKTITMDDLVSYVPHNTNLPRPRAVMKIDIEDYEARAFQKARKLFDAVDFCFIFMEWRHIRSHGSADKLVLEMMEFLYSRGFKAYDHGKLSLVKELKRTNWKNWPIDIAWKKAGF